MDNEMIPNCLVLTDNQKKLLERFISEVNRIDPPDKYNDYGIDTPLFIIDGDEIGVNLNGFCISLKTFSNGNTQVPLDFTLDEDGEIIYELHI